MTDVKHTPLLDLDTLVERPCITIDGERYAIRSPGELSVVESHRFGRWGKRIEELDGEDGDAAEAELDALVAKVCKAILVDVPDDVFAKLPGTQRWAIIDLFTALRLRETLKVAGAMTAARGPIPESLGSPTGVFSSPGLSGSMAARPRTGFTARLRRWFGLS